MNIQQALTQANKKLASSSPSPQLDAQVLLTHILKCNSAHLLAWPEKMLSEDQQRQFQKLVQQRQQGLPVAHLTGEREFWSLALSVNNSTLIPRPETETLVEFILDKFGKKEKLKVLDMGTGSGAIAIAIASEKPGWTIFASDLAAEAVDLARHNCDAHQISNITLLQSDWFNNISDNDFDIIVSNPPYITSDDPHLLQGDVRFEPKSALTSGLTGMDDIKHLCANAKNYLTGNGYLIVEHGYNQKLPVAECFANNGYTDIEQAKDLSGHTRMTAGKKV